MTQINPFVPAIANTPQAQRLASADRDAQLRRTAQKQRTSGFDVDREDEYVESADAVEAADDREQDHPQNSGQQKHRRQDDADEEDRPHLDVKA